MCFCVHVLVFVEVLYVDDIICVFDRKLTEYQSSFRSPLHRIPEEGGATDSDASQVRVQAGSLTASSTMRAHEGLYQV